MAKSNTTNVAYYFARRKDTGMAGVWFTHCATTYQKDCIVRRLVERARLVEDVCYYMSGDIMDTRFRVAFLEKHFVWIVKSYIRNTANSIAFDLTLKVIQESNPEIRRIP